MSLRYLMLLAVLLGIPSPGWAITFSEVQTGTEDGSDSNLATAAQNLASGSLNIACVKWEGATTLSSITDTAGNTYTLLTNQSHSGGEPHARCGYVLSATANATNVVTFNFSGATAWKRGAAYEFAYSGTAAFDVEVGSTEADTDTTPSSNTLTTTGTEEACVAFHADYTGQTFSNHTINAVADDGTAVDLSDTAAWYRILSATFTGGASSLGRVVQARWVQRLQCFRITAGGGGGTASSIMLMGVGK